MDFDYIIIGAGIMGLSIARALLASKRGASIALIEKEREVAFHASGRNSGVLHAGFYYSSDSLKAKFTKEGNLALRAFCKEHGLAVNPCGKMIVATNEEEVKGLHELKKRGEVNKIDLEWISREEAFKIDPNVNFFADRALYSPTTATVDPVLVCRTLLKELQDAGVKVFFNTSYLKYSLGRVFTSNGVFEGGMIINAAGLYADRVSQDFGFGREYTLLPFKGIYLKSSRALPSFKTNIYPVPNLKNPFLGVHFTITVDNKVKIGPTAIPAFWRENYLGTSRFNIKECLEVLHYESKLFFANAFNFRSLAFEEMRKYNKKHLLSLASKLVKSFDPKEFTHFAPAGIRAQLLHKKSLKLVQDFVVEADKRSIHLLNSVSPAFTCSLPFARFVVEKYTQNSG